MARPLAIDALREGLEEARARTLLLVEGISDAEGRRQVDPAFSPLAWHLGHVGWQEEVWALRRLGGQPPIDPALDEIFDSFGSEKASRGSRLPALEEVKRYLATVRARSLALLQAGASDREGLSAGWVFHFLGNHERQHAETMAVVRLLADLPLAWLPPPRPGTPPARELVRVEGGSFTPGSEGDPEAWDNERGAHPVEVAPFWIARHPVTNGEWIEFIEAGGYGDDALWCAQGIRWREASGSAAPLLWIRGSSGWERRTLAGLRPVDPSHPVAHVSWFEACAFARFAGARLPTEEEWELAASWDPALGKKLRWPCGEELTPSANLDLRIGDTAPCDDVPRAPCGAAQMLGQVWEWTSSSFRPYPGFRPDPYRGYSEPWFGDEHRVLRGGSYLTHPLNARASFRNWFQPWMRAIPTGLRLAKDG